MHFGKVKAKENFDGEDIQMPDIVRRSQRSKPVTGTTPAKNINNIENKKETNNKNTTKPKTNGTNGKTNQKPVVIESVWKLPQQEEPSQQQQQQQQVKKNKEIKRRNKKTTSIKNNQSEQNKTQQQQQQQQKQPKKKQTTNQKEQHTKKKEITSKWGKEGPITFEVDQTTALNKTIEAINKQNNTRKNINRNRKDKTAPSKKQKNKREKEQEEKDGFQKPKQKSSKPRRRNRRREEKNTNEQKSQQKERPKRTNKRKGTEQQQKPTEKQNKKEEEKTITKKEKEEKTTTTKEEKLQNVVIVQENRADNKTGAWLNLFPDKENPNYNRSTPAVGDNKKKKKQNKSNKETNDIGYEENQLPKQHVQKLKKRLHKKKTLKQLPFDLTIPLDQRPQDLLPRGLKNVANTCWMNAVIQMLLYIPEFYNLMMRLDTLNLDEEEFPLTTALIETFVQFPIATSKQKKYVHCNMPSFEPTALINFIKADRAAVAQFDFGAQHDAQEFALFLIERLHEELNVKNEATPSSGEDGWMEVGKGKAVHSVNEITSVASLISNMFGGRERSLIQSTHRKKGSLTIQPYFMLHLPIPKETKDIQIEDCFQLMTTSEQVENGATRVSTLETPLPPILMLQMKRFKMRGNTIKKKNTHVNFHHELVIQNEWLSENMRNTRIKYRYELLGVIIHSGPSWEEGHYSVYVKHPVVTDKWIHLNDEKQTVVSAKDVETLNPYMFVYRRQSSS